MEALNAAISLLPTHWVCTLVVCTIVYVLYRGIAPFRRSVIVAAVGDLPGPKPLPFIGNAFDMIKTKGQLHLQFDDYYTKYGRLFTVCILSSKPSIVVSDLEMLKEIFVKEFQSFHDRPSVIKIAKPYDKMMTAATGETWHRIRSTLSPTFSGHKMKVMVPLLSKSCDILLKKLHDAEKSEQSVNIHHFFKGLTMEAILSAFFGIESNAQLDENDAAFATARKALTTSPFRRVFLFILLNLPGHYYLSQLQFVQNLLLSPFLPLKELAEKIVEVKQKAGKDRSKDFLDLMLTNVNDPDIPEDKRLTEDEVIAQSTVFLLAGYETTSNPLSFVCYHLATNPEIQEKVQREIDDAWSDVDQPLSYDVVNSLTYLEMVISETLRLYPPAFMVSREATKDCTIKGLPIKKGIIAFVPIYSIHRDPEYYPDPEKFDPERFSAEAKKSRDPYAYLPFGHGPRNCIGMRFALFEMKMTLARILKKFSFDVCPKTKIPPEVSVRTLLGCGKDGLHLGVQSRDRLF